MAGIVGHPFRADSSSLIKDEWGLRMTWNLAHSNPFVASLEVHPATTRSAMPLFREEDRSYQ